MQFKSIILFGFVPYVTKYGKYRETEAAIYKLSY